MLLLMLRVGDEGYAIAATEVAEVAPRVELRGVPHAPDYVAGLCNYRGLMVPVVDLCRLLRGRACRECLSTRRVLVAYPAADGARRVLGLLAEGVTDTFAANEAEFASSNIATPEAPYLDRVVVRPGAVIQRLRLDQVLPESLRRSLFPEEEGRR